VSVATVEAGDEVEVCAEPPPAAASAAAAAAAISLL
jgi:hypothetical protein